MARPKREMIPTESVAAVVYALARRGVLTTVEAAEIGEYAYTGVDRMLNKAERVIPLAKPRRGVWMVNDEITEIAEQARPLLDCLRDELKETPPQALYCRPMKRSDMAELVSIFEKLMRNFRRDGENETVG